ncbi:MULTISPECIES: tetratricopeptide repeat protein [unclassified Roseofilum]|uniref:tetratricopeptide repeat protein n=1 Tax=unclassified Roseofilum TaxID=2620099 RepID=UPI001B2D75DE|nr:MULTISPECIES: tetratricopeptide repeat protein [unclassified Roseofilum]MBP0008550.1 tetratricopeptide repeat protein [Roseofilum sp. Belize Diploria]MBP0033785.1 tetratricopeptide repeat protein [Roseofilum sp. Belize BBD 4]
MDITAQLNQIIRAIQGRQLQEAANLCGQILQQYPQNGQAWHLLGVTYYSAGDTEKAIAAYENSLTVDPNQPQTHNNLATALAQSDRPIEALKHYQQAIALAPDYTESYYNLAKTYKTLGNLDLALQNYQQALHLNPDYTQARQNLGNLYLEQGEYDLAIVELKQVISQVRDRASIHHSLAFCYHQKNDRKKAISHYQKALELNPQYTSIHANLSSLLHQENQIEQAIPHYKTALSHAPNSPKLHHDLAVALGAQKQFEVATDHYYRSLELEPNSPEAHNNLGVALSQQEKFEEAIAEYHRALELNPHYPDAYNNLAVALDKIGEYDGAIAAYQTCISLKPDYAEAHTNLGIALLLAGDLSNGWAEYEWRYQWQTASNHRPVYQPRWNGDPFVGRTLLLYCEQGFGDCIQFLRYLPLVQERGGKTILECPRLLMGLFETFIEEHASDPKKKVRLVARDRPLPNYHIWAPLMSLPYIFGTTLDTIPASIPYLRAPVRADSENLSSYPEIDRLVPTVDKAIRKSDHFKVGLAWGGNPNHGNDRQRSCQFTDLLPWLDIEGIDFYSLQKGDRAQELAGVENITNLDPIIQNFADTATLIDELDLIITVDTSLVHLAGAMGKPTWLLLSFVPDWRWMLDREDSPWYPTVRLFRQPARGDWHSVITAVKTQLVTCRERFTQDVQESPKSQLTRPTTTQDTELIASSVSAGAGSPNDLSNPDLREPAPTGDRNIPRSGIGITWQLGNHTGWGIYGLNLALQLVKNRETFPHLLVPPGNIQNLHPLHQVLLRPVFEEQKILQRFLNQSLGKALKSDFPIFHGLGHGLGKSPLMEHVYGHSSVGIVFIEDTHLEQQAIANAKTYDRLIAGSSWNAEVLTSAGISHVETILQGIDPTLFHPAAKLGIWGQDRFVIFAGGKLEYRKGQDLIIAAFKAFHHRHPDVLLVTAWHNAWPSWMVGLDTTGNVEGLPQISQDGVLQIMPWLQKNGIPAEAAIALGPTPNHLIPQILREADVAIFTSRAEGGTNLAAMECLACGIPTLLSANTGHLDLLNRGAGYPLKTQYPVASHPHFQGTEDWGNSDIEEILETLEWVYHNRTQAKKQGKQFAKIMQALTWEQQIQKLL